MKPPSKVTCLWPVIKHKHDFFSCKKCPYWTGCWVNPALVPCVKNTRPDLIKKVQRFAELLKESTGDV